MKTNSTEADIPASNYSDFFEKATRSYSQSLISRLKAIKPKSERPGFALLDIGTGTGNLLIHLANDPDFDQGELVGVDFSEPMIHEARRNAARQARRAIRFEVMDVHELDIPDGAFELVTGRSIIHHFAHPARAFAEMHRILRPGGVVLIHEPSRTPSPSALAAFNARRAALGCAPMRLDDKYTHGEIEGFLLAANLGSFSVTTGDQEEALGFEICIKKRN